VHQFHAGLATEAGRKVEGEIRPVITDDSSDYAWRRHRVQSPSSFDRIMNSFLNACGISRPLQLAVRGSSTNESGVRLLHQPFALIGRDQRADVPLDHKLVSRRHVYLQVVEGQAFWIDLDSRSGTLGDGQLRKFGWLEAGKVIRIGPFELQRLMEDSSAREDHSFEFRPAISPLVARSHVSQPLPEVVLEFLNGPSRSACWPMNRMMSLIGSAGGCKFRLADPSVASFHCSLLRTPLGLWVVDLLGSDGIGVNDALVRYALLADNDVLKVGRYRIRIRSRFAGWDQTSHPGGDRRTIHSMPGSLQGSSPGPVSPGGEPAIPGFPALNLVAWPESLSRALAPLQPAAQASSMEWISPGASEPARLEKGELTESVLVPLVNQFGLMQQQMLDQFQQAISMLVQMFGTLHRDQMELIRRELDQLRDLTKEFHALKLELAAHSQARAPMPSIDPSVVPRARGEQGGVAGVKEVDSEPAATSRPAVARTGPASAPISLTASPPNGLEGSSPSQVTLNPSSPEHISTRTSQAQTRVGGPNSESDRDVIVWLHQRMMTLQQERETRWQKILKLLPGLS
jgi:pSer/pThr/pTyr-binding forkhead associated (FHA) protein